MPVRDPERLLGKLGIKESLFAKYGFDVTELNINYDDETIEDVALRGLKHTLILEGGREALVLRQHKEFFIHEVRRLGRGVASDALNVIFEIIEYDKTMNKLLVYVRAAGNYLNQKVSPMYAICVVWGKNAVDNDCKFYWDTRHNSNQFIVNQDNTLGLIRPKGVQQAVIDTVLGCNDQGDLILVNRDDFHRRLVFKDLFASLTWRLNYRLSTFRMKDLTKLSKKGFMKDWQEPGTNERKLPGRLIALEMMGRIIHEFIEFGAGNLVPGDGYFGSRIDRCSKHELELVERSNIGEMGDVYDVLLSFQSNMFDKCVVRVNTKHKALQYIASQFFEVNLDITYPPNLMFDVSNERPENTHFLHHVVIVGFSNDADSAKDDPSLPVFFERVTLEESDIKYINDYNRLNNTRFTEHAYYIKWIGKIEHAFDVR